MKHKPGDYLSFALNDLEQMDINRLQGFKPLVSTCYHAQQYAEKMMKEGLVRLKINPPQTHDLTALLKLFPENSIPEDIFLYASVLNPYMVTARYPTTVRPSDFSTELAEEAYDFAILIGKWIFSMIDEHPHSE